MSVRFLHITLFLHLLFILTASGQDVTVSDEHVLSDINSVDAFIRTSDDETAVLFTKHYNMGLALFDLRTRSTLWSTGAIRGDTALYVALFDVRRIDEDKYFAVGISCMPSGILYEYPATFVLTNRGQKVRVFMDSTLRISGMQNRAMIVSDSTWCMAGYRSYLYQVGSEIQEYGVPSLNFLDREMTTLRSDTLPHLYTRLSKNEIISVCGACKLPQDKIALALTRERNAPWAIIRNVCTTSGISLFSAATDESTAWSEENPILSNSDSCLLLGFTRRYYYRSDDFDLIVQKFLSDGTEIFTGKIHVPQRFARLTSIRPTKDGGCIVTMRVGDGDYRWQSFQFSVARLNAVGDVMWLHNWTCGPGSIVHSTLELYNNDVLVGGTVSDSAHNYYGYTAVLHPAIALGIGRDALQTNDNIKLSNPVDESLAIHSSFTMTSCDIYDMTGVLVLKCLATVDNQYRKASTTELASGSYMLVVQGDHTRITRPIQIVR